MGWDPNEVLAYDVADFSIKRRTAENVQVLPLRLNKLSSILTRPIEKKDGRLWCPISQAPMATEFAISRFCVPFLTKGWALFVDSDIVCLDDIVKLFEFRDDRYAVMVVKHNHETGSSEKMGGQVQTYYSRKNWSSVILWNCDHESNKNLTIEKLNTLPGRDLHAFCWLKDEEIGELRPEWNFLVGVETLACKPKIAHYTLGGPWITGWQPKDSDQVWNDELDAYREALKS